MDQLDREKGHDYDLISLMMVTIRTADHAKNVWHIPMGNQTAQMGGHGGTAWNNADALKC